MFLMCWSAAEVIVFGCYVCWYFNAVNLYRSVGIGVFLDKQKNSNNDEASFAAFISGPHWGGCLCVTVHPPSVLCLCHLLNMPTQHCADVPFNCGMLVLWHLTLAAVCRVGRQTASWHLRPVAISTRLAPSHASYRGPELIWATARSMLPDRGFGTSCLLHCGHLTVSANSEDSWKRFCLSRTRLRCLVTLAF